METLLVTTKDKKSANFLKKVLKTMQAVENVIPLSNQQQEDLGLSNAITEGFTGNVYDAEILQKKLRK